MNSVKMNNSGSTIIDALIGFGILGLVTSFSVSGMRAAQSQNAHDERITSGVSVAESVMEELYLRPTTDVDLLPGSHQRQYGLDGQLVSGVPGYFNVQWTVTPNTPVSEINTILIQVNWQEGSTPRQFQMKNFRG